MVDPQLVDRLAAHRTIGKAPRAELEWLAEHGEVVRYEAGDITSQIPVMIQYLWVMLTGRMSIRIDRGAGPRKVMEWVGGDVTGLVPYSRMQVPPGTMTVEEATEGLRVPGSCFREMIATCHELTTILVHVMLDRARMFTSSELHRREDGVARPARGRPRARAEQPGLGRRARRQRARSPSSTSSRRPRARSARPDRRRTRSRAIDKVRVLCETDVADVGRSPLERRIARKPSTRGWRRTRRPAGSGRARGVHRDHRGA